MHTKAFPTYTFDLFHREFMFQCLAKFRKIQVLWIQFFLKKLNSSTINYQLKCLYIQIDKIETRKELTAEWNRVGVNEGIEYAILTDDISKAWSGMSTKEYKQ